MLLLIQSVMHQICHTIGRHAFATHHIVLLLFVQQVVLTPIQVSLAP